MTAAPPSGPGRVTDRVRLPGVGQRRALPRLAVDPHVVEHALAYGIFAKVVPV